MSCHSSLLILISFTCMNVYHMKETYTMILIYDINTRQRGDIVSRNCTVRNTKLLRCVYRINHALSLISERKC